MVQNSKIFSLQCFTTEKISKYLHCRFLKNVCLKNNSNLIVIWDYYSRLCNRIWDLLPDNLTLTLLWDLLPGVGRVHEGGVLDLVVDVLVLVEGKRPAQADVDDDADRPHVQRSVVSFAAQHLGCQVGRSADHRAPERLFPDDTSKAEVAELHLEEDKRGEYSAKLRHFSI